MIIEKLFQTQSPRRLAALCASVLLSATPPAAALAETASGVQLARLAPMDAAREQPGSARRTLSERTVLLYQEIFELQAEGAWKAADALLGRLGDETLLGHLRYQRYMHPTAYRSSYQELASWLQLYGDHPDAEKIYKLALKRRPRDAKAPTAPARGYMSGSGQQSQEVVRVRYRSSLRRLPYEGSCEVVKAMNTRLGDWGSEVRILSLRPIKSKR
jgi:hypothetical protein